MEKLQKAPQVTAEGRKQLEAELNFLKTEERDRILSVRTQAEEAPEGVDSNLLKYAKLCESFNDSRIKTIEELLVNATTVDPAKIHSDNVVFGATVVLTHEEQAPLKLKLVSVNESDIRNGKLSIESHLGKLLLGKVKGDRVLVNTPDGEFEFLVSELRFE